ncbi:hypothetical protein Hanom_Chr04g00378801 [Helianthus anomalus]
MSNKFKNSIDQPKKKICAHIFQFVLHIINHYSLCSSDYQQPIEQRICSVEDLLITTHTNDQHVISANLLIHQSSQRPGLQHQEDTLLTETNDQPNVAAIFEIPQSSEPARDHHQGIIFKQLFIQISIECRCSVLKNYIFFTKGTRIIDMNKEPDVPTNLLTHPSSEQAEEHHQGIILKLLFIQVGFQNR